MASLKRLIQTDALSDSMISMLNPGKHSQDLQVVAERQRRVRPSSNYNVLLTVVNPEPDKLHVSWKPEIPLNSWFHFILYFFNVYLFFYFSLVSRVFTAFTKPIKTGCKLFRAISMAVFD